MCERLNYAIGLGRESAIEGFSHQLTGFQGVIPRDIRGGYEREIHRCCSCYSHTAIVLAVKCQKMYPVQSGRYDDVHSIVGCHLLRLRLCVLGVSHINSLLDVGVVSDDEEQVRDEGAQS